MTDTWDAVLTIGAVVAALGIIFGMLWKGAGLIRRLEVALSKDAFGKTSIDRLNDRAIVHDGQLAAINYQLHPNGGGSLSDKVTAIETDVAGLKSQGVITVALLTALVEKE